MIATLYAKLAGIGIILLVIAGFWMFIHHKNAMIDELELNNKTLAANNLSLSTALDVQNTAILKLKADSDKREADGKVLVAQAAATSAKKQQAAGKIYATAPPASGATCEVREQATLKLVNGAGS